MTDGQPSASNTNTKPNIKSNTQIPNQIPNKKTKLNEKNAKPNSYPSQSVWRRASPLHPEPKPIPNQTPRGTSTQFLNRMSIYEQGSLCPDDKNLKEKNMKTQIKTQMKTTKGVNHLVLNRWSTWLARPTYDCHISNGHICHQGHFLVHVNFWSFQMMMIPHFVCVWILWPENKKSSCLWKLPSVDKFGPQCETAMMLTQNKELNLDIYNYRQKAWFSN